MNDEHLTAQEEWPRRIPMLKFANTEGHMGLVHVFEIGYARHE